jgi:CBS-domain-containing membrane protein
VKPPRRPSAQPLEGATRARRRRLTWRGELALAVLPTVTILVVLGLVEVLSRQRLLFASLASSAFLIYLDPQHGTNTPRTLIIAQLLAATAGLLTYLLVGPGYPAGGTAMLVTIVLMILLDVMHPPAVSTSLSFAFRAGDESNLMIFALAVAITAALVGLERVSLWLLTRDTPPPRP